MTELRGLPVATAIVEKYRPKIEELTLKGKTPTLAIVRVGERPDDLVYERGALKRFSSAGALVKVETLPADCTQGEIEKSLLALNSDPAVHGILIFRPLPKHLSEEKLKKLIDPEKDVDCFGDAGYAGLFIGSPAACPPCTPQAVIELIDHYRIDLTGKRVTVVGRSLVVGKPLAVMLIAKNATVTVCHTRTRDLATECSRAEVLIAAAGSPKMIGPAHVSEGQVVIDVGINMVEDKLCGDVDFDSVKETVAAITPVPGGVGSITTAVLLKHTVENAIRQQIKPL